MTNKVSLIKTMKTWVAGSVIMSILAVATAASIDLSKLPPASPRKDLAYANDISSLFEKHCVKCHGPTEHKGKLRLDSLAAALKGGGDGKVILPGKGAQSLLLQAASQLNKDLSMPPKGKGDPLTAEQLGLIRAWIDQGAK